MSSFPMDIEVPLEDDLVLRQGAGLVGAEDIHRPEILDGIKPFDDGLAPRHHDRAFGEIGDSLARTGIAGEDNRLFAGLKPISV